MKSGETNGADPGEFPVTRWTLVLEAGEGDSALEELCQAYWRPIRDFLLRCGNTPEDAEDLTQDFFAHLINGDALTKAREERGRLRSFLLALLKQFLSHAHRRRNAIKRGGKAEMVSLDVSDDDEGERIELADEESPDTLFEKAWAKELYVRAAERVEKDYASRGLRRLFAELKEFLSWDSENTRYGEVATRLAMTESNLRSQVYRSRRRFREALEAEVADTVTTAEQAKEEMEHLLATMRGA